MVTSEGKALVGMSVQFSRDQREALQKLASRRQLSMADIVREAVRDYLASDAAMRGQREDEVAA
jgi:predicted transcriptional regulator